MLHSVFAWLVAHPDGTENIVMLNLPTAKAGGF
jgi:hypothetical protein